MSEEYIPPKVWTWDAESGGKFANINRPIAGPTSEKEAADRQASTSTVLTRHAERRQSHSFV